MLDCRRIPGHSLQAPVTQIARRTPRGLAAVAGLCIAHPGVDQKMRVRIANLMFVDYLTWHRIDDKWLITSKGFHLEAA